MEGWIRPPTSSTARCGPRPRNGARGPTVTRRSAGCARRYGDLQHDEVTAVASELWSVPVFERRLATIVLLQRYVESLTGNDLTRIEGLLRDARVADLIEPLTVDVVRPLLARLRGAEADRARRIVARWASSDAQSLQTAAALL